MTHYSDADFLRLRHRLAAAFNNSKGIRLTAEDVFWLDDVLNRGLTEFALKREVDNL